MINYVADRTFFIGLKKMGKIGECFYLMVMVGLCRVENDKTWCLYLSMHAVCWVCG
jgi:hypothetical protein